jgi:hypothetical protein
MEKQDGSSSDKSSAHIHDNDGDNAASVEKMASMSSRSITGAQQPPNELIVLGSPVLLPIVMSFLDRNSLNNCRQVCQSWEDAARRTLMKRCDLDVEAFFRAVRPSEQNRVELYSSWSFEYNSSPGGSKWKVTRAWTNFLRKWGNGAKSLTLRGLTIEEECLVWIRKFLCECCRNVADLSLEFENSTDSDSRMSEQRFGKQLIDFRQYLEDGDEVKFEEIWMAKEDHAFTQYPLLPNILSLRVSTTSNEVASFLSINVLLSCPKLKHLFVSEQRFLERAEEDFGLNGAGVDRNVKSGWKILDFLSERPNITLKLETFEWLENETNWSRPSSDINNEVFWTRGKNGSGRAVRRMPFLQFGDSLKRLHWNVLHLNGSGNLRFPGVLEQVAGNLRKLNLRSGLKGALEALRGCLPGPGHPPGLIRRPLPPMPSLSTLQIGFVDCFQVCLSELVDAAPNLSTLQISACECEACVDEFYVFKYQFLLRKGPWEVRPSEQTHPNLKCLKSELVVWNMESFQWIVDKFPNIEELWIGVQSDGYYMMSYGKGLKIDSIFHTLEEFHSLKRFNWSISGPVKLHVLLAGLAEAGEKLSSLESCHIHVHWILCPIHPESVLERQQFEASRTQVLDTIFKMRQPACKFVVTTSYANIFVVDEKDHDWFRYPPPPLVFASTWKDLLLPFIERHRIPIEFRCSSAEQQAI